VIIGNTALYGATSGRAFISGISGERFAVRNSGAIAVIEGVGDHACEYMTGGRVVVLGGTGKNFAAGMSGGIAYIFNSQGNFAGLCNQEMVDLTEIDDQAERSLVHELVSCHFELTGSKLASRLLEDWDANLNRFVRVIPRDYRRVLEEQMSMERREDLGPISSRLEEAIVV
jgi:glutamate synthase (ferredoxin)